MPQFYLLVEGQRGPKRPHPDIESARAEAARLYLLNDEKKSVFILQAIDSLEPKIAEKKGENDGEVA